MSSRAERVATRLPRIPPVDGVGKGAQPRSPASATLVRISLDLGAIGAATLVALFLRFDLDVLELREPSQPTVRAHLVACALWTAALWAAMFVNRLYDEDTLFPGGGELARLLRSITEAGAILSVFVFVTQSFYVSRGWFALTLVLSGLFLAAQRRAMRRWLARQRRRGRRRRRVLLASADDDAFGGWIESVDEFEVVSRCDPADLADYLADAATAPSCSSHADALFLRTRDFESDELWRIVLDAGEKGHAVFLHSGVRAVGRERLTVRELAGRSVVKLAPPSLAGARKVQKRVFDLAAAAVLMFVSLPVAAAIAASILVTSGRPVLYSQERVGMDGKRFRMWKFRTMRRDSEAGTGPLWTTRDDPRRTRAGAVLRRLSLDELPQLFNVLTGDMSLVGPRPERPFFAARFSDELGWYRYRHRIRPGMTGWAQAHGLRGNTPVGTRVELDNWYIEHWSLPLDIKIMLRTLGEIVRGGNAY